MIERDVVIVGGGISGLAAAYRLGKLRPNLTVTLLESSNRLGGKLLTERIGNVLVEASADSFLSRKPRGIGLVKELGLLGQVQGRRPENKQTFVQRHGRLHPLPEGFSGLVPADMDALRNSTLVSAEMVARLEQERSIPPLVGDTSNESVADFMSRRMGSDLFDTLIEPLLGGIYGGRADLLSLDATFPQLRTLEQQYGSLLNGFDARKAQAAKQPAGDQLPPFVSLQGGLQQLVDALAGVISAEVQCSTRVKSCTSTPDGRITVRYTQAYGETNAITAKQVIIATQANTAGSLLAAYPDLQQRLHAIPYSSSAIVTFAFDMDETPPPVGYGYVIPRIEGKEVLACTWSSQKWANRAPDGTLLLRVYCGRYGVDVTDYSYDKLREMALAEVREGVGISAEPTLTRIHRWKNAIPQYTIGHEKRILELETIHKRTHSNIHLAGAYFDGVGIPNCIASGERAAENVAANFPKI